MFEVRPQTHCIEVDQKRRSLVVAGGRNLLLHF